MKSKKLNRFTIMLLLLTLGVVLLGAGCDEDDSNLKELNGYIVGFDPCTVNHQYRIGYVIVSTDLKDTLVTYNISDETFKMPASVLLLLTDTLYKIPESYFNAGRGFYFPESARSEFKVIVTYRNPKEDEKSIIECTNDLFLNYEQIIITSLTK